MAAVEEESGVNLECRMYEQKYPDVDDLVMVKVRHITEMGAYVTLLEYDHIEGMILLSELSRSRFRSVNQLIRVNRMEVVTVLRVDTEKGYIDLSKRRVQQEDLAKMETKWNKSKTVHSIMRQVAKNCDVDLEELYIRFGWPLYKQYGHAFDAFKLAIADNFDAVFGEFGLDEKMKEELITNISSRFAKSSAKCRADVEVTCFEYEGIDAIKAALRAGQALADDQFEIEIKLVAPPLYVISTTAMDRELGIKKLQDVCDAIGTEIKSRKGNINIKPRAITAKDEKNLNIIMEDLERKNAEVDGDSDHDEGDEDGY